ncbi:hypothetical protein PG995_009003 [Apiospora arundinis]
MVSQLSEQIQADRVSYRNEIQALHEGLNGLRATLSTPQSQQPDVPISSTSVLTSPDETPLPDSPTSFTRKKPLLPDPAKFNGTKSTFRAWLTEMRNKLLVDGLVMGTNRDQFMYIFARLERTPQNMTIAFMERGGTDGQYQPQHYLSYLESCYGDPNLEARAIDRLQKLAQKDSESFATFLPKFERELADGGGSDWPDRVKISWLRGALNITLKRALAGIYPTPSTYPEYVRLVQVLGSQLDELTPRHSTPRGNAASPSHTAIDSGPMDWEPTRVHRAILESNKKDNARLKGKRAKWVSSEDIERRKREGRCIRCSRHGCSPKECPLQPPRRPESQVFRVKPEPAATESEDEHDDSSDLISLKD